MNALTTAMGSGTLKGTELDAVLAAAPGISAAIAQYMGVTESALKGMGAQGLITASVVKNAMFSAAEETNTRFAELPTTWAQAWSTLSNTATTALAPLLSALSWVAANIQIIGPLVLWLGAVFTVFQLACNWTKLAAVVTGVYKKAVGFLKVGFAALTGSAKAAAFASEHFNSTLLASPVIWVVLVIAALIALLYAGVAAFNKLTGSAVSATGLIVGAFLWMGALLLNLAIGVINALIQLAWTLFAEPLIGIVEWVLNVFNGGFESFGGAVANLLGQIISWFLSLGKVVTKIIDAIFGTNWTDGLSSLQNEVLGWGKTEGALTLDRDAPEIDHRFNLTNAFDTGYSFGEGLANKAGGLFDPDSNPFEGALDPDGLTVDQVGSVESVGSVGGDVNIADEDLKFMKDVAEMRYVQNFVTLTPTVAMNANISERVDVGGVISEIGRMLDEEFVASAQGVYV